MPPLSDSHHHLLPRLLDCLHVLITSVLPKTALASLQSVLITEKWPFRKKKESDVPKIILWLPISFGWVEPSPPAPRLQVFAHFIYSPQTCSTVYCLLGAPLPVMSFPLQQCFLNRSDFVPREQVTMLETFLMSCLRGRKYHRQTVSREEGCCYSVESIESPHNKEPSIPKHQGEQSFRSPVPWH